MIPGESVVKSLDLDTSAARTRQLIELMGKSVAILSTPVALTLELQNGGTFNVTQSMLFNGDVKGIYLTHAALPGGTICIAYADYPDCVRYL